MFRPRVIPCLLLKDKGLVKTIKFQHTIYLGDPINAVRIYNEKEADELIFLDITASKEGRSISVDLVGKIANEAYMPFAVGGGISNIKQIRKLISAGAEKVVINTAAVLNPNFIREVANIFGSQSIIISIDIKKSSEDDYKIYIYGGREKSQIEPIAHVKNMENMGAGEIFINSIDKDGTMEGYDNELIRKVVDAISIPVIACGGAGSISDLRKAIEAGASAVAAGSLFTFYGRRKAVLINYLTKEEIILLSK